MKRKFSHPPREEHPSLWRSAAERDNAPGFEEVLTREFPAGAAESGGYTKRDFLRLMGASFALAGAAGLSACRRPEAHLVPFNHGAEWAIPGKFLYYATAMPRREGAMPLVAATVDGRPVKLEGNALHPYSNGGTDGFAQAAVLDLYDPHRARVIRKGEGEASWADFEAFLREVRGAPEGVAFLVERRNSPTRDRLRAELEAFYPGLLWCEYEPLGGDAARRAVEAAFGPGVRLLPKFERADVILALDSDFLNSTDHGVGYAAGFFPRRNPDQKAAPMNRLYVVENHYTVTGGLADHRYRCKASLIGEFACRVAEKVFTATGHPELAAVLGAAPREEAPFDDRWIAGCADDLLANPGRSLVTIGGQQPVWAQAVVLAINEALTNHGATILLMQTTERPSGSIADLASALEAGQVRTLFLLGGNPAYNAPADLDFARLIARAGQVVRLSAFEDESSRLAMWKVPEAHFLETWGDVRAFEGTYSVVQPMILPLWNGVSELDVLAVLAGRPRPTGPELVRETFTALAPEGSWDETVRQGFLTDSPWPRIGASFNVSRLAALMTGARPIPPGGLELVFLPSSSVDDGRYANNSWLQETPDFETKVTWDNVALLSPATARRLGVRENNFSPLYQPSQDLGHEIDFDVVADLIEIKAGGVAITAAAVVAPGHADDSISLALGYGRKDVSALMEDVGFNAYPLRVVASPRYRLGVEVRPTGGTYALARTQEHRSMEGRQLFREGTLERYEKEPQFARRLDPVHLTPTEQKAPDFLTAPEQWGMTVDLNTCLGCNACLVACQAENNVPVVGKEQVRRNRDMAWLRIDRYFAGDPEAPEMLAQAVMCQHCENAPCEPVCPVNATVHGNDGLNLMVYNRCIGTRYCANNCPWKVRRFNYFDYNERPLDQLYAGPLAPKGMADSLKMSKNPNVTVRMRGVMEKCTFCIQRIESARIARLAEAGPRDKRQFPLREIQTACQQACPSGSLVFGNIADPNSRVACNRASDRGYVMLQYLNTRPRVTYLARVKNPNKLMPGAELVGSASGAPEDGHE